MRLINVLIPPPTSLPVRKQHQRSHMIPTLIIRKKPHTITRPTKWTPSSGEKDALKDLVPLPSPEVGQWSGWLWGIENRWSIWGTIISKSAAASARSVTCINEKKHHAAKEKWNDSCKDRPQDDCQPCTIMLCGEKRYVEGAKSNDSIWPSRMVTRKIKKCGCIFPNDIQHSDWARRRQSGLLLLSALNVFHSSYNISPCWTSNAECGQQSSWPIAGNVCWNIERHNKNRFVSSLSYWLFSVSCCDSR